MSTSISAGVGDLPCFNTFFLSLKIPCTCYINTDDSTTGYGIPAVLFPAQLYTIVCSTASVGMQQTST